ncbi:ABC-type transporter, integral membrane subunit [Oleidesulfovibrio alaskensis G20]|uniref:ABC-type transporter, integral membrane subunit n=1 Tax=Oleidesulfovibrio alaskensis (strain ATCC BAA-1058 / DSM 17464 / G20) TaxID=207559 RepID=Q313B1_OLEA2|nr:ABC transporter permease [Oleidesulfovibrio alaskensis]ABB37985.1 ABC-type transporter, integral membrane subunit [Oleidesulfovibrio alaskensis G20]MBG0772871.1 ABC transporter permease [Oleidesulfovibrio alaskensis]MBL3582573.1 ABC transporter permease [Oleidesulfovibrio alaskensis]
MLHFLIKRLLQVIPTVLGISVLVFFMIHLVPGDPAEMMLGERANEKALTELRQQLGLDKPLYVQYGLFMSRLAQGDLGRALRTNEKITTEIATHFPATLELALVAIVFAVTLGMLAGIVSATRQYSLFDYGSMVLSLIGVSMPIFWLGLVLMIIFSVNLGWLPLSGRLSYDITLEPVTNLYLIDSIIQGNWAAFKDALHHIIMPAFTLSTIPMAIIARMTRSSMLEVLRQDYIRTAKAKGLSPRAVHYKHALRNALIPIVTIIGLQFSILLGGAILTETIFAWPGIGSWLLNAVYARDFNAVQGGTMLIATLFVLINVLVDLLYAVINPRIKV